MLYSHYGNVVDQPKLGIGRLSSLHELDAQLIYLTENTEKKEAPNLKHDLVPCHVTSLTSVCRSSIVEKGGLPRLSVAHSEEK